MELISEKQEMNDKLKSQNGKSDQNFHAELVNSHGNVVLKPANETKSVKRPKNANVPEEFYLNLVNQLTKLSLEKVKELQSGTREIEEMINNQIHFNPQRRILEEKQEWKYVEGLHKCAQIHLNNSLKHHQFYVDCKEFAIWMKCDLQKCGLYLKQEDNITNVDEQKVMQFIGNTKELVKALLYWRLKIDELKERSYVLVPIHMRLKNVAKESCYVRCIHDFQENENFVHEDEELLLIDNSDQKTWKVRSQSKEEFVMPSSFLIILLPDFEAQKEVDKLRELFQEMSSTLQKVLKRSLIKYLNYVFDSCDLSDENGWKSQAGKKLEEIRTILSLLDELYGPAWHKYPPYAGIKTRIDLLKLILSSTDDVISTYNRKIANCILVKDSPDILELLKSFQEICKNGYNLQRGAQNNLNLVESFEEEQEYDVVYAVDEIYKLSRAKETMETSQLTTSEQEENQTFVITGVINPSTKREVSLKEAIALGIINPKEGKYVGGPEPYQHLPIPTAMNQKLIKVELTKTKKSEEKRNDFGFITIKSYVETRPYVIKSAVDPLTKSELSLEEAVRKGMVDQKRNIFKNFKTKKEMSFEDALDQGFLLVDFGENEHGENGATQKHQVVSYAVFDVLDTKRCQWMNFKKAVELDLLNPDEGTFYDTANMQKIKFMQAIQREFVKAKQITDTKSLELPVMNRSSW